MQPDSDRCDLDFGEGVNRKFFVAGGNTSKLLEFFEAALDAISQSIQEVSEDM